MFETIFGAPTDRTGLASPDHLHCKTEGGGERGAWSSGRCAVYVSVTFTFRLLVAAGRVPGGHNVILRVGSFESDGDSDGAPCSAAWIARVLE